jgi:hypothetical protein
MQAPLPLVTTTHSVPRRHSIFLPSFYRLGDIRFKDYGMESLEVTDNGSGLDPSDYETLGMTLPKKLARM